MILVSACLLGLDCRYDGSNVLNRELMDFLKGKEYTVVCPEQLGGLTTPRKPCEIVGGDGSSVLEGISKVVDNQGRDVSKQFIKGAEETLKIIKLYNIKTAILKSGSPSCGSINIHDGSFSGKLIRGKGVTTALLEQNSIVVLTEKNYMKHI
ncbi:MAG: DUF523 domain-containing protein [Clostridia bacterium]|nr:DUF523 domain-containing protein [Clostridia bacterium]